MAPSPGSEPDALTRLGRDYEHYATSGRKRRAWSASNPGNAAIRAELLERALRHVPPPPGRVLDSGCGGGWWLRMLAANGIDPKRLAGIDALAQRVAEAREALPGADIAAGDVRELPYDDATFNLNLMFTVLSSMPSPADRAAALREAQRVLAVGGTLLVYEPRIPNPLNRRTGHVRKAELAALGGANFESLTVLPALARRLGPLTARAYRALARVPVLRSHRLAVWTKPPES